MPASGVPADRVAVGRVKDAHGLKGELFIVIFSGDSSWLPRLKTLRLVGPDETVFEAPVASARPHKNGILIVSPSVADRTQAERLRGFTMDVPGEFFVSKRGEAIYLREIEGFTVRRPNAEAIGPIVQFSSNGAQDLLIVRTPRGEFPIPFVKEFVANIDYANKQIEMNLPHGLLGEDDDDEAAE